MTPGNGKLTVSWTQPSDTSSIVGYEVDLTSAPKTGTGAVADNASSTASTFAAGWRGAHQSTLSPSTTSLEITGLTNDQDYRVRARTIGFSSNGPYSHSTGRPKALPPGPVRFTFGGGEDNRLQVGWRAAPGATGYDVHYTSTFPSEVADDAAASGSDPTFAWAVWNDPVHTDTPGDPVSQRVITGLTNGLEYRVRIRAKNSAGAGPWTIGTHTVGLVVFRPSPDPDLLTGLTFSDGANDLPLQPNVSNGIGLGTYAVHVAESVTSVSVTLTFTNADTVGFQAQVRNANRGARSPVLETVGWGVSGSGQTKTIALPGHATLVSISPIAGGGTYDIYIYQRGDWEAANARLKALAIHGR